MLALVKGAINGYLNRPCGHLEFGMFALAYTYYCIIIPYKYNKNYYKTNIGILLIAIIIRTNNICLKHNNIYSAFAKSTW